MTRQLPDEHCYECPSYRMVREWRGECHGSPAWEIFADCSHDWECPYDTPDDPAEEEEA